MPNPKPVTNHRAHLKLSACQALACSLRGTKEQNLQPASGLLQERSAEHNACLPWAVTPALRSAQASLRWLMDKDPERGARKLLPCAILADSMPLTQPFQAHISLLPLGVCPRNGCLILRDVRVNRTLPSLRGGALLYPKGSLYKRSHRWPEFRSSPVSMSFFISSHCTGMAQRCLDLEGK